MLDFCCPHCVSQNISNNSPLYPILFALSSTLETYMCNKKEEIITYLFWDCPKLDFLGDGSIKDAQHKQKKTLGVPTID